MTSVSNYPSKEEIQFLEKINELIDLCIDNGCYGTIKEMIPDDKLFCPTNDDQSSYDVRKMIQKIREMKPESVLSDTERGGIRDFFSAFLLGTIDFPVGQVSMPKDLQEEYPGNYPNDSIVLEGNIPLKPWSCLFLAKLIRAELIEKNRNPWLKLYDKIIQYLEANIRLCFPAKDCRVPYSLWEITQFHYLMELSATSLGEASIGYAERAKGLCKEILRDDDQSDIYKYGHPYHRWIWYNQGIAYHHTQRHKEALGQFNEIIDKFFKKYPEPPEPAGRKNLDAYIEFLLNIAPSFMQKAELNIQGQLAYHALNCLDDNRLKKWLKSAKCQHIELIDKVVEKVKTRRDLLRLEALLRLGDLSKSKEYIEKLHPKIENENQEHTDYYQLPQYDPFRSPSLFQVEFIEQKVIWYREEAIKLLENIGPDKKRNNDDFEKKEGNGNIDELQTLIDRIKMIKDQYWMWVQDNPTDKKVYFSNWAQFLGKGMKIIKRILEISYPWVQVHGDLLESIVKLYDARRELLPDLSGSGKQDNKGRIVFEDLGSENPFGFVMNLNDFYEGIFSIKSNNKAGDAKELIRRFDENYYDQLRADRDKLFGELDKWEQTFGEFRRIEALNRYNVRIKWLAHEKPSAGCKSCIESDEEIKKGFSGLLTCCKKGDTQDQPEQGEEYDLPNFLHSGDYETIMSEAKEHFRMHLKDYSSHVPVMKSLHFMGLQRWNSLTPAQGKSIGGGYFLYHTDERGEVDLGIAIDPGFDFVRNLFRQGFSIRDIDIVLISHAHADHLWDFESIVQLLHDQGLKDDKHRKHRINVILTRGAYKRYEHVISNHELREFIEPIVIDLQKEQQYADSPFKFSEIRGKRSEKQPHRWKPRLPLPSDDTGDNGSEDKTSEIKEVVIQPTYAYHDDHSQVSDSYGFKIEFVYHKRKEPVRFGYTGDTKWVGDDLYNKEYPAANIYQKPEDSGRFEYIVNQYLDCQVLLIHIGSLIDREMKFDDYFKNQSGEECDVLIRDKNHLYLMGMIRFLKALVKGVVAHNGEKLILVGEFGEELQGGIRIDIVKRLKSLIPKKWHILPVDVGLDVLLNEKEAQFICAMPCF